ncbi:hypothetical protein MNV_1180004 [Candidatus Methanoperedens nitroreducens]|uniref:Uncharacterized protein n=1 Tax=Candidatus Methanoperedens nitratireducens TaxID=1392998 RepID=A0A284VJC8_9EURY|nr:hypothetical protein MNV_1180004 [Candidatus Methanoperedens nitroreducens]
MTEALLKQAMTGAGGLLKLVTIEVEATETAVAAVEVAEAAVEVAEAAAEVAEAAAEAMVEEVEMTSRARLVI